MAAVSNAKTNKLQGKSPAAAETRFDNPLDGRGVAFDAQIADEAVIIALAFSRVKDDGERECAYDAKPKSSGKLKEAPTRGWTVLSMKTIGSRFSPNALTARFLYSLRQREF